MIMKSAAALHRALMIRRRDADSDRPCDGLPGCQCLPSCTAGGERYLPAVVPLNAGNSLVVLSRG